MTVKNPLFILDSRIFRQSPTRHTESKAFEKSIKLQNIFFFCALSLTGRLNIDVKLLTEHNLEFLSFQGGCTGSSESTLGKRPHYLKSHVAAHIIVPNTTLLAYTKYVHSKRLKPAFGHAAH